MAVVKARRGQGLTEAEIELFRRLYEEGGEASLVDEGNPG